jgi:hypothetical protein
MQVKMILEVGRLGKGSKLRVQLLFENRGDALLVLSWLDETYDVQPWPGLTPPMRPSGAHASYLVESAPQRLSVNGSL